MKSLGFPLKASLLGCFTLASLHLHAVPVTNWHTFRAGATTLSGQGTSNPVWGSASLPSSASFLVGYFQAMSLTNLGDRITFSYQVSFTDAGGIQNAQDNFRYALFDLNGQTPVAVENSTTAGVDGQTDNWRGYWFGIKHSAGVGSLRERIAALVSGDNIFAAASPNDVTVPNIPGFSINGAISFASSTEPQGGPTFNGIMILEKTPSGVAVAGTFTGNGSNNVFMANDNASPFPSNYGAVGYLNGNPLNCEQVNLQNVSVNYSFSNALVFVTQPVSVLNANPGQTVQFSASWTGSGAIPFIQWRENGTDIPDATNATYTIASVNSGQNNNIYSIVVSNVFGNSITSTNATLTVIPDTNAPTVLSVSSLTSNSLNVIFSERVDAATAQDSSSYSLSGNSFSSVTQVNGTNILLATDNPITTNYLLLVQNVKDLADNTMASTNMLGIAHGFQATVSISITNGSAFALNEKPVIYSDGLNIFAAEDHCQFVYKPISGDFDLAVRVESLLDTDANARAGLMARVDTFFDSRNVLIEATPGRFIFQYRTNASEATFTVPSPRPPTSYPNCWIRLVRNGSVFSGYSSTNGVWDLIASHDTATGAAGAYPNEILVGLVASAGNPAFTTRAQFSGFGRTVMRPTLTVARSGANVEVSWPASSLGFTLQATPGLAPTSNWTNVPGSTTTNRVFVPTGGSALFFRAILE